MGRPLLWARRRPKFTAFLLVMVAFVMLNVIAFLHAYAMTHFADRGDSTPRPETLSLLGKAKVILTGVTVPKPFHPATPAGQGMEFVAHRIPSTDNIELESWFIPQAKSGPLVLVVHGYASCKARMLPEAAAFHQLGYTTLLIDLRSSGGSSGRETTIGMREADDVAAAYRYAQATWPGRPLVLFGTSMGSVAILRAVQVHGLAPQAMIIECPFDRLLSTVQHRFDAMGLPSFPFAQLLVFWGGVQHGFNGFGHNPVEYARSVCCPVLQLHGTEDARVHPEEAEAIFQNLGSSQKRFEMLAGVGHESYVSARPQDWKRLVKEFLAEVGLPPQNP